MNVFSWLKRGFSSTFSSGQELVPIQFLEEKKTPSNTNLREEIKDLLQQKITEDLVIVEAKWFSQLESFIQGGERPEKMENSSILTKKKKLRKGLKESFDFFFVSSKIWEKLKKFDDEKITLDINKKLKKLNYVKLAEEHHKFLLQGDETSRIDPTDIKLPLIMPRNECQENIFPNLSDEDLKKDSLSTNHTSSLNQTESESNFSNSIRFQRGRVGFDNPGLFCYLNAGIQCLLSMTHFIDLMIRQSCVKSLEGKEACTLIIKLIKTVFSMRSGVVKPTLLWKYVTKTFPGNKQHDMPEFMRFIINQIEAELGDNNLISKYIFNGMLTSNVVCMKCLHSSNKLETFIDLQIELSESIEKSFDLFTQEEIISTGYYCTNCKTHFQALKSLALFRPPNYLILQIKRFRQTPYMHKLTSFTKYKRKMIVKTVSSVCTYELIALGVHIGSINSGHYVAYAKRSRSWYCFDDSLCSKVTLKNVLSQHAYILVYKIID